MPKASYVQESFLGGQWSPFAQGGFSEREYKRALKVCLNAYPIEEGAWVRRSGFKRAGPTRGGGVARIFKWDFVQASPVTLEFTDQALRFWSADQIMSDGTGANISSVAAAASPTQAKFVTDSAALGWVVGDHIFFQFVNASAALNNAALANRQFEIVTQSVSTTQVFTCKDTVTGTIVLLADLNFTAGDQMKVVRILELATPYTPTNLPSLRRVATDDKGDNVALICDGVHKPQSLLAESGQFAISPAVFNDGPYLDPVPGALVTPDDTSGLVTLTLSFEPYSATKVYDKGEVISSSGVTYQSLQDVNLNNTPASSPTFWKAVSAGISVGPSGATEGDIGRLIRLQDSAENWTWGKIISLTSSGRIDPSPPGSANIGTMTGSAGLAGAFTGVTQANSGSAESAGMSGVGAAAYAGKDFGSSPQSIASVMVYPPTDGGLFSQTFPSNGLKYNNKIAGRVDLYASNTAPASPTSGVYLGSSWVTPIAAGNTYTGQGGPAEIVSNDPTTLYRYVWCVWVITTWQSSGTHTGFAWCGRLDMFTNAAAAGTAFVVQIEGDDLADTGVIFNFQMGAYSDSLGWPKTGCYHEGRLWLTGAIDNRFDGSRSNLPFNMSPSAPDGTVTDSSAINATLNSSDVNPIFWMMPDLQGILLGTQAGEWLLQASNNNNVLTPTSRQAHRITKYGCANAEPVRTGLTTCFIQRFRRRVHEFLSDVFSGKFYAPNLTEKAKDITQAYVQEIDYQEELAPIVWGRAGDGSLIGCTYRRIAMLSHEPPEFRGWHEHAHGTGGTITSIAVGADISGNLDALSAVVQDASGGCTIQVMQKMFDEEDELPDAAFLDGYLVPAAVKVNGSTFVISGLLPLAGQTLQTVFLGGLDCGDYTVSSTGTITVPFGADPDKLLNPTYLQALPSQQTRNSAPVFDGSAAFLCNMQCLVGTTFTSRGQILPPMMPEQTGARTGPAFGKVNKHSGVAALLHKAVGVSFGTDFDNPLKPAFFKSRRGKGKDILRKDQPFSGTHYMELTDEGTAMDNSICWQVTRPYPCTVVAIGGFDGAEDE